MSQEIDFYVDAFQLGFLTFWNLGYAVRNPYLGPILSPSPSHGTLTHHPQNYPS
jgi:hypothetical protein